VHKHAVLPLGQHRLRVAKVRAAEVAKVAAAEVGAARSCTRRLQGRRT